MLYLIKIIDSAEISMTVYKSLVLLITMMCAQAAHAVDVPRVNYTKPATNFTKEINKKFLEDLPFQNKQDFEDAKRGFIAALPMGAIKDGNGKLIWDLNKYEFLKADTVPDTINPSLWRIAQLNMNNGLFQVTDRIYQIRGFDMSNMTIIEGNYGIIIFDPLISKEAAKAGLDLYYKHRPKKPVVAVLYTHSHVDHYGGVKGVVSEQDVKDGKVQIIAPAGFLEEAISENVYAGNAMGRRAQYQYGIFLEPGPRGQIDVGLGKGASIGEVTLISPTTTIETTGQKLTVDGIDMEFQMAPGTEAPSEMLVFLPQFKALCAAEDLTHTMHNLYTLRGAKIRDANKWWKAINTTITLYGGKVQVIFAQHHWPKWGNSNIVSYMEKQRNQFKYIHDQSLRLMNMGYTPIEVAEALQVPDSISNEWYNRGYYGSTNHNSKGVYQLYLGWYDSNPANLHPILPVEAAKKYVEYMGGTKNVLKLAQHSYNKGEYRWVAEVLKHVVFADPTNINARNLQADAFEQLGYQQENPTWRNEYLMGALELRRGVSDANITTDSIDTVNAMPIDMLFDYIGLRLNGPKAKDQKIKFNMRFIGDPELVYGVSLEDGVLIYTQDMQFNDADVTVAWPKSSMIGLLSGVTTIDKEVNSKRAQVSGDKAKLTELFALQDNFRSQFDIISP